MYTMNDAERAMEQHGQSEKKLKRFKVAVLRQLCVNRGIQVDEGGSRLLKKPYIDALLIHQKQDVGQSKLKIRLPHFLPSRSQSQNAGESGLKIRLPRVPVKSSLPRKRFHPYFPSRSRNERGIGNVEDRNPSLQSYSEEQTTTVQFTLPTATEHLHGAVDTSYIPHVSTFPVTPKDPRIDTAPHDQEMIPAAHADRTSTPARQRCEITIPSKRPCPFGEDVPIDVPRKKKKKERFITVRVYQRRKDLEHTNEVKCALTPDGGLDLVSLAQKLNVDKCQVIDPRSSRPWFRECPILEGGAIKLLKAKEGYLRLICQPNSPLAGDKSSKEP